MRSRRKISKEKDQTPQKKRGFKKKEFKKKDFKKERFEKSVKNQQKEKDQSPPIK
ncbi:hypothetical protein HpHA3_11750 [Helicobacter pylori]